MIATWLGGPFDGRTDELPDETLTVCVAVPMDFAFDPVWEREVATSFRESRCDVIELPSGCTIIVWHEPT